MSTTKTSLQQIPLEQLGGLIQSIRRVADASRVAQYGEVAR